MNESSVTRDIPPMFQKLYRRAKTGRSQQAAIRSFCVECVGYVLEEVKLCTDTGCPLYEYRLTGCKVPKAAGAARTPHGIAPGRTPRAKIGAESIISA